LDSPESAHSYLSLLLLWRANEDGARSSISGNGGGGGSIAGRLAGAGRTSKTAIEIRTVTRVENGRVYCDNSKQCLHYPQRTIILVNNKLIETYLEARKGQPKWMLD
jgi:hypothetical protein